MSHTSFLVDPYGWIFLSLSRFLSYFLFLISYFLFLISYFLFLISYSLLIPILFPTPPSQVLSKNKQSCPLPPFGIPSPLLLFLLVVFFFFGGVWGVYESLSLSLSLSLSSLSFSFTIGVLPPLHSLSHLFILFLPFFSLPLFFLFFFLSFLFLSSFFLFSLFIRLLLPSDFVRFVCCCCLLLLFVIV